MLEVRGETCVKRYYQRVKSANENYREREKEKQIKFAQTIMIVSALVVVDGVTKRTQCNTMF